MSVPSNQDFAAEVRSERLTTLWRVTAGFGALIFWLASSIFIIQRGDTSLWILAATVLVIGSLITRFFLRRNQYTVAVWCFAIMGLLAASMPLLSSDPLAQQIGPFTFPVIVFLYGLLMTPVHTALVGVFAIGLIVGAPIMGTGMVAIAPSQTFAILLVISGLLLASQVTGEIFQITDWALSNYDRERRTNHQLFENRQELERALRRSQVLGEQLQETNVELDHARSAAEDAKHFRGQFLANMSHELRTPLNAIIGFSETMLNFPIMYDEVKLPSQYESDLRQIFTSGKSLLHLINDILDLAKVDAGKLEVVMQATDLDPIIRSVLALAGGLVGAKPIELKSDISTHLPKVWADETRVRQVLLNLYSNAAKFTDTGTITLKVQETVEGVQFSLIDTGSGVQTEDLGMIFEEFKQSASSQGRDPRSGAGLGLAISRQLLGLMGGRIWAESELGKGSTFHFVVQRYDQHTNGQPVVVAGSASVSA